MVRINLLPWRIHQQLYEKRITRRLLLIAIGVTFMSCMAVHYLMFEKTQVLQLSVDDLSSKIAVLPVAQVNQSDITHHRLLIENRYELADYQQATMDLLTTFGKIHDAGVCFTEIHRQGQRIIFNGNAYTEDALASLIQTWNKNPLFGEIKIEQLGWKKNHAMQFLFYVNEKHSLNVALLSGA